MVFNRFWRADPARARTSGGTGLGLSISLEDTHLHGGWLQAWGRPGEGAQFRLTLPRHLGTQLRHSPLPARARRRPGDRMSDLESAAGAGARAVAACALLAGCVQMPTEGPVEVPQVTADVDDVPGISFDPRPPRAGESAADIVAGFLEAMKATPDPHDGRAPVPLAARRPTRGSPSSRSSPTPSSATPTGETAVRIPMKDVNLYDARGAWQRTVAARGLGLGLVEEDGEWRIDEVPDALIVPDSWFDDWYQRVSLYFFDPTSEVLVPEPVFAPRGDQLASSLVRGLLTPAVRGRCRTSSRTYFPAGTTQGLSVPISSGIAEVALVRRPRRDRRGDGRADAGPARVDAAPGAADQCRPAQRRRPRDQPPGRLDAGRPRRRQRLRPRRRPGQPRPLRPRPTAVVVRGAIGRLRAHPRPARRDDYGLRSIGVDLSGSRVAGSPPTAARLLVAPTEAPDGEVSTVDLRAPSTSPRPAGTTATASGRSTAAPARARVVLVVDGARPRSRPCRA